VAFGTVLAPLNSTMIAMALPQIVEEFETGVVQAGWSVAAYLIVMSCLQPVAVDARAHLVLALAHRALLLHFWCGFAYLKGLYPSSRNRSAMTS
jgi:MFS family permease